MTYRHLFDAAGKYCENQLKACSFSVSIRVCTGTFVFDKALHTCHCHLQMFLIESIAQCGHVCEMSLCCCWMCSDIKLLQSQSQFVLPLSDKLLCRTLEFHFLSKKLACLISQKRWSHSLKRNTNLSASDSCRFLLLQTVIMLTHIVHFVAVQTNMNVCWLHLSLRGVFLSKYDVMLLMNSLICS